MSIRNRQFVFRILVINLCLIALLSLKQGQYTFQTDEKHIGTFDAREAQEFEIILGMDDENSRFKPLTPAPKSWIESAPKIIVSLSSDDFSDKHLGGCPDYNCKLTEDRSFVPQASAIIHYNSGSDDIERPRNLKQYHVHFTLESPTFSSIYEPYANFYNLTMSFLRNSDIPCPYGFATKSNVPRNDWQLSGAILKQRNQTAVWLVSHCGAPSYRAEFVQELQKYISVDIFGSCGKDNCPRQSECDQTIHLRYRFYLALENSLCKDYLTEKLWGRAYKSNLVPIVMRRSLVEKLVPPKSFIAIDDFKTIKDLAEHLKLLMQNNDEYMQYFEWRRDYRTYFLDGIEHNWKERNWGFCRLCKFLQQNNKPSIREGAMSLLAEKNVCDNDYVKNLFGLSGG